MRLGVAPSLGALTLHPYFLKLFPMIFSALGRFPD